PHIEVVATPLRDGVDLVEQEHTPGLTSEVEDTAQVGSRAPQVTAHHRAEVEDVQWQNELPCDPARRQSLPHPWGTNEDRGPGWLQAGLGQPLDLLAFRYHLKEELLDPMRQERLHHRSGSGSTQERER